MSIILISEVCEEGLCHEKAVNRKIGEEPNPRRYFNGVEDKTSHLNLPIVEQLAGDNAVMIVPIDIDEDGRMDILVQKSGKSGYSLIYNNYDIDSFFIKAIFMSQLSDNQNDRMFGAITTGATFRYIVTTLDDKKFVRVAS